MLAGRRILIVDDETVLAENLRDYFSRRLAEVMLAPSGEYALEVAPVFVPDVVIASDRLPGMDGIGALGALADLLGSPHSILVTDRSDAAVCLEAQRAGIDHVLEKPFALITLEDIIALGQPTLAPVAAEPWLSVVGGQRVPLRFEELRDARCPVSGTGRLPVRA